MNKIQAIALAVVSSSSIALARPVDPPAGWQAPSANNSVHNKSSGNSGYTHQVLTSRASVRPNPGSWYVGSLDRGEQFKVRGVRGQWAFGDARGDVKRQNVWILRNRLDKGPLPTATKQPISNTREYLKHRDASWISPGRSDGVSAKLKQETVLYGNYNPRTGKFSDRIKKLDPDRKNRELHMRYISKDRDAAVVRYSGVDPTRRDAKGKPKATFSQWGFVKRPDVRRR